jgi:hypothetical protein
VAYLDSALGTATVTLSAPPTTATRSDSALGTAAVVLNAPITGTVRRDSALGTANVVLKAPHRPVVMLTTQGLRRLAILAFDGTRYR